MGSLLRPTSPPTPTPGPRSPSTPPHLDQFFTCLHPTLPFQVLDSVLLPPEGRREGRTEGTFPRADPTPLRTISTSALGERGGAGHRPRTSPPGTRIPQDPIPAATFNVLPSLAGDFSHPSLFPSTGPGSPYVVHSQSPQSLLGGFLRHLPLPPPVLRSLTPPDTRYPPPPPSRNP